MPGKYLIFSKRRTESGKTQIADITNHEGAFLGKIAFHPAWRRYCFFPMPSVMFDTNCLTEVMNEIETMTKERKDAI